MNISDLSANQLRQAAAIKEQIEKLQDELTRILGMVAPSAPAVAPATAVAPAVPQKRAVSAATRAKIAAAQRQRWAVKQPATTAQQPKGKRKMSAATKALLSAKQKAYWAKKK